MKNTRILHQTEPPKLYSDLKLFCELKGIKYNTFNRKQLPFEIEGAKVYRLPIITK